MKPEQQRIAIAEACGWKYVRLEKDDNRMIDPSGRYSSTRSIPDYLNDLNAMHEAEKTLPPGKMSDYSETLPCSRWLLLHATASQRAEAFLRTLNLWKDE